MRTTAKILCILTGSSEKNGQNMTKQSEFYDELIRSLPGIERAGTVGELDSEAVINRAELLDHELSRDKNIESDFTGERTLFLAALRNLKLGKITAAQLATIHLVDSAIHTLYINPMLYLIYKFLDKNNNFTTTTLISATYISKGMPNVIKRYPYDILELPQKGMPISALPHRMQQPLMKRFFNFSDAEWEIFCEAMAKTPLSEQSYHVLNAPEAGCWSSLIFQIQKLVKCMRILDRLVESKEGFKKEEVMLVPSFSMFQAAINAKAHTLGRKTVELIPTYGYIEPERYTALKASGKIALTLYMPEKCTSISDMNPEIPSRNRGSYKDNVNFRTTIDGHDMETAFAGAIHDVYHAMREIALSENIAKARMRLASIAKTHPRNKCDAKSPPVDEILVDGELIFSFPPTMDTIFNLEYRAADAQLFGDLFYTISLRAALHEELKKAFLKDMVINKRLWKNEYNIGRSDLREEDQAIFDYLDAIESCKPKKMSSSRPKGRLTVLGITTAIVTLGILGATRSRGILSHSPPISNLFAKNQ